ncbi:MAG: metal ABC transporter substrate-binding protein [Lawsonibacter sp.]|jgi:zinc transport system substrate-binding protein
MIRRIFSLTLVLTIACFFSGCGVGERGSVNSEVEEVRLQLVATTYPIYLLASSVTQGVEGIVVERLNTGESSCLHDYTLSVDDMKKIEGADIIVLNGAGLEDFMDDALSATQAKAIDCSAGVTLLENLTHDHAEGDEDGHDHGHWDPHYWMDPSNAVIMAENLATGLVEADPDNRQIYEENMLKTTTFLNLWDSRLHDLLSWDEGPEITGLVTFHDGFQYFAKAFDLPLLAAIEEEAGSEASAKEIQEITALVKEYNLPIIFTEVNGSDATAKAIARETGCAVGQLTMLMDGVEDGDLQHYYEGLQENVAAIVNGFAGEEIQ